MTVIHLRRRSLTIALYALVMLARGLMSNAAFAATMIDSSVAPTAYGSPVGELPPQMQSVIVNSPADNYVLPGEPNQPVVIDNNLILPNTPPPDPLLGGFRNRAIQRIEFDTDFIPRNGRQGIGSTDLDLSSTVAIPFPILVDDAAFLLTPDAQEHFLDGPDSPDLPPRLIDASLQIALLGKLPGNFVYDVGIQPGWHSDGSDTGSAAFRLPYYFAIGYRFTPRFLLGAGAANLDWFNIHWVPLAGLIWVPEDDTRFELVPPRPRLVHRFWIGPGFERWWYFAAEFGGGEWEIRRANGAFDLAELQDWRIINGIEQIPTNGGLGFRIEYGYVFSRHVSYQSGTPSFDPPNTFLVRLGVIY